MGLVILGGWLWCPKQFRQNNSYDNSSKLKLHDFFVRIRTTYSPHPIRRFDLTLEMLSPF
jgi:hypothetical protein